MHVTDRGRWTRERGSRGASWGEAHAAAPGGGRRAEPGGSATAWGPAWAVQTGVRCSSRHLPLAGTRGQSFWGHHTRGGGLEQTFRDAAEGVQAGLSLQPEGSCRGGALPGRSGLRVSNLGSHMLLSTGSGSGLEGPWTQRDPGEGHTDSGMVLGVSLGVGVVPADRGTPPESRLSGAPGHRRSRSPSQVLGGSPLWGRRRGARTQGAELQGAGGGPAGSARA